MRGRLTAGDGNNHENHLTEIVETLEARGLSPFEYRLHDYIDPEALGRILSSTSEDIEVQFTVRGTRLSVTEEGVSALGESEDG